jgi:hypothetical protein
MSAQAIVAFGIVRQTARHARLYHRQLIRKEFLNDRPTRQKRTLISQANAERISTTLFDHSHTIS